MRSINLREYDQNIEVNTSALSGNYSHEAILNPIKIRKGQTRWNQCTQKFREFNGQALEGPVLDIGCGVGYFVYEGLQHGVDIRGVDRSIGKIDRYRYLIKQSSSPEKWAQKCFVADGTVLPFPSNSFSAVTSWWVLEHIADTKKTIHEMVRITKPKGIIVIRAQDARADWEGHCKVPWIPYLSANQVRVWVEEFGGSLAARQNVYDVTQPQIISLLKEKGCRIVSKALTPPVLLDNVVLKNYTEGQIRQLAQVMKNEYETGRWCPKPDGLYLYAQKA